MNLLEMKNPGLARTRTEADTERETRKPITTENTRQVPRHTEYSSAEERLL